MEHTKQYSSYAAGAFGHDMFYATLSTYLMLFVTSQLFDTSDSAFNARMIGYVTLLMTAIRLVEIIFDPEKILSSDHFQHPLHTGYHSQQYW